LQSLMGQFEAADQRRSMQLERVDGAVLGLRQVIDAEREQAGTAQGESQKTLAALSDALAEIRAELIAWREDSDRRIAEHDAHLGRTDDELKLFVERFAAIESGPILAAETAASNGGGGASAAPSWSGLLVDLASPNAGIRWQAVVGLGDTKDPAVVPNLLPMLADNDVFVRMACARVLGDLGQTTAVPALIDALGNEADRAKKVKAWREWWKKLQEEPESAPG
jgi:HEAT repeat protein